MEYTTMPEVMEKLHDRFTDITEKEKPVRLKQYQNTLAE
jgi:hypothetical protein